MDWGEEVEEEEFGMGGAVRATGLLGLWVWVVFLAFLWSWWG